MRIFKKILSLTLALVFTLNMSGLMNIGLAEAATITNFTDVMSTQAPNVGANHTVSWKLVGGDTFATGETFKVKYNPSDFTLNAISNWKTGDFTFNDGTARTVSAVSTTSGTPPTCTAGANNVAITIDTTTAEFTVTACGSYTASAPNANVTFGILGENVPTTGTGILTNKSTDVDSSIVTLTASNGDSAIGAVVVETNSVVNVTATVNPILTFAINSPTVSLGTLSSSSASTGSHTVAVGTNAAGGFLVTYNGSALSSGANTIPSYTNASSVPGTAGFGINLKANTTPVVGAEPNPSLATCPIASSYDVTNKFTYNPGTTTPITNNSAPASCTYTVSYVANIATTTPAGLYSTALTYVASGTF